jgi:hypothetical protein
MKKSTGEEVCNYLFQDIGKSFLVLGQNSCTTLKWKESSGQLTTFKEPGTNKDLFLKKSQYLVQRMLWEILAREYYRSGRQPN